MSSGGPTGFLLVDKERGWTSHDVVAKVRGILGLMRVGHAGTLDPMATGLLVLGVGRATRLLRFVQAGRKRYEATARFGVATDSLDADGAIMSRSRMPVERSEVEHVMGRFVGTVMQVPPMVSARKVDGTRLYELARRGETVEREARPVQIFELEVTDFAPGDYPEVSFVVECSTGTYVRSLAADLAAALGGSAHLTALRRTAIGSLAVSEAIDLGSLGSSADPAGHVIGPASGLPDLPRVEVEGELERAVRHGTPVAGGALQASDDGPVRIVDSSGELLAVYEVKGARATAAVVLA